MQLHRIALAVAAAFPFQLLAQGIATDAQLKSVQVSANRAPLDPNLPSSTASRTAEQLREQTIYNPEDIAVNLPSTTIRKRYLGDRNSNVGGRSYGTLQPGRALVYLDGYLISNFLGRFDAPRWNMVNVEAIERIDALYGPFSAIYPGNSIGTTLIVTERKPKGLEASASIKRNQQGFSEYATSDTYTGQQLSARIAARLDSGLWYAVSLQHQDSEGHTMGYANAVRGVTAGAFATPTAAARPVSGIVYDRDPQSRDRALFGANSIDHSKQDTVNLRLGFEISPTQEIEGRVSWWHDDSTVRTSTWLRDAAGNPVWSGAVRDGAREFTVAPDAFAPSLRDEVHRQLGATWKTKYANGWNASVVVTDYQIVNDATRQATLAQPLADQGGAGSVTRRDGTGWNTLEMQSTYTPTPGDFGNGQHALVLGLHRNQYTLQNVVNNATDWRAFDPTLNQNYDGKTTITALYAQDAWKLLPDWMLTTGLRVENFESFDGSQYFAGPPVASTAFPVRSLTATSPKLSLAWSATADVTLKTSLGRGVRFPNVDELFNGTKTGAAITTSDPNLRPEVSDSLELSAEREWGRHWLRASFFRDDVTDTILRQLDATVTPTVTRVSNVDRVLTLGLELVWATRDVGTRGLDLGGSATWTDAQVKANAANPAQVGKQWLRIPPQRYTLQASYRPNSEWVLGAAWRWASSMFNTELNVDDNPNTYGGTSSVNQLDLKVSWKFVRHWEWGLGVNNAANQPSWQGHTMPQRSVQTELRYSLL
jgi:iron complex outermembrane receptor protein